MHKTQIWNARHTLLNMHTQTTKQVLLESVQGLALHAQPHITMHQHTQYCQYTSATQHVINMLRLTCWHTKTKSWCAKQKPSCAWATCIQQWCGCTHIVVMCLYTQHCKLYLSHGVVSCVHMLCMCGRMWNVDCISWSMCACLCLLFMHAVQLHISCKFVCAVCGALCVSSMWMCVCMWITDCIDMSMNKWINEHVVMQIMKDHFLWHTNWKKLVPILWHTKLFVATKKTSCKADHLAKNGCSSHCILANVPECTQQKNGCSSLSASATAAAHSLIW